MSGRRFVAASILPIASVVALACRRPHPPAVCEPPPREKVTSIGACPVDWGSGSVDADTPEAEAGDSPEAEAGDSPEPVEAHQTSIDLPADDAKPSG